jgi:hypothetical protein
MGIGRVMGNVRIGWMLGYEGVRVPKKKAGQLGSR